MFELLGLRRWMLGARIGLEAQPLEFKLFLTSINMFSSRIDLMMGWLVNLVLLRSWFEAYKVCEPIMTFMDILDYFALSILLSLTFPSKAELWIELFNKLEWAWLLLFLPPLFSSIWESLLYLWLNILSGLLVAEFRTLFSIFLFCPIKIVYLGIWPLWAESLSSLGMFLESIFIELRRLVFGD